MEKKKKMIHILGAPRTGSTLLYQLIVNHFCVNYVANNGMILTANEPIPYTSQYGKTYKPHEPSEASNFLMVYFRDNKHCLPEMRDRLTNIVQAAEPFVMKNIWNVWRVDEWERLVGACKWIWIRRDTASAAYSDYLSHNRQGGLNGAYLKFEKDIFARPMDKAIIQQKRINEIIEENLYGKDYIEIWYKDLVGRTRWQLVRLQKFLQVERRYDRKIPKFENHNS